MTVGTEAVATTQGSATDAGCSEIGSLLSPSILAEEPRMGCGCEEGTAAPAKRSNESSEEEVRRLRQCVQDLSRRLEEADSTNEVILAYARELREKLCKHQADDVPELPIVETASGTELRPPVSQTDVSVLGISSLKCSCGQEAELSRVMAEYGKVFCSDCWCSWERCGWWKPSIRVMTAPPPVRTPGGLPQYVSEDSFMLPAFCCAHDDLDLFHKLKDELPEGSNFSDWHGGRHLAIQFEGEGARHSGEREPVHLKELVASLEAAFGIRASASRLNLYRSDEDFKPFHHDRGMDSSGTPQVTVGAAFGSTRELTLLHCKTGVTMTFPMRNGDVFSFTPELNYTFMHGVPKIGYGSPSEVDGRGERLSLILWGSKLES